MNTSLTAFGLGFLLTLILLYRGVQPAGAASLAAAGDARAAPAFTHVAREDWLNSEPLTWSDLRGQVVLLEFWTFDCWNCYRSIPWLQQLEGQNPRLRVIGVHTPELPQEYVRDNVVAKVREFKLTHAVMLDNDYSYWKALDNRYWPAFYLIDKRGRVRGFFAGETHAGDANARRIGAAIATLEAEPD